MLTHCRTFYKSDCGKKERKKIQRPTTKKDHDIKNKKKLKKKNERAPLNE